MPEPPPIDQPGSDDVVDLAERLTEPVVPAEPAAASDPDRLADVELRVGDEAVVAEVGGRKVGEARLLPVGRGWGVRIYVHPAWRRRGLGLRLLHVVAATASDDGIHDLDIRLDAHDLAGLRLVLASGLCGSISCDGGETRTRLVLARRGAVLQGSPA